MRYLRMLSNSVAAALLGAGYVLVLVLQLNPALPLAPSALVPLAENVGAFYAIHLTVAFYVLIVVRQILARELFSPAWLSARELLWMGAVAAAAGSALMWANARAFETGLDASTIDRLKEDAALLAAAAAAFAAAGVVRSRTSPAAHARWGAAVLGIAAASLAGPLALRGPGQPAPLNARPIETWSASAAADRSPHVIVIAVDAASLDILTSATAQGRLPNFGRILDAGAVMRLATIRPTAAEAVWAAVSTGKLPPKNGVQSAGIYRLVGASDPIQLLPDYCFAQGLVRFGFVSDEAHTSATLRVRPLWTILSALGTSVGVVAWPLTHPAPVVRGYLVSDAFVRLAATASGIEGSAAVYPPAAEPAAAAALEAESREPPVLAAAAPGIDRRFEEPGRIDRADDRIAAALAAERPVQVTMVRYLSLDPIGHYFLRYAAPVEFGEIVGSSQRDLALVLERHYAAIDQAVGRAMASLRGDDLLLVISGYGMEPVGVARRLLERAIGDRELSGTHDGGPDGFLLAYGAQAAAGRLRARGSVVDLVPTILYFLGLPIGRDMDGYARTDLFQRSFTDARPITYIPTYDR